MHPYPVRVCSNGEAAAWDPDLNLWCSTTGARLSGDQVADWIPCTTSPELDTGAAVFAAALTGWAAHWPPKVGNDVELEPIYAPLAELNSEELEQAAIAARDFAEHCWRVRRGKMIERARERETTEAARDA